MSCYVFLTPELGNMGGAQMYTNNKVSYLKKNGWDVQVFYYKKGGEIKLPELVPYKDNYIKDFRSAFYYVPKWYMKKIVQRIREKVKDKNDIIIETHLVELAYWGEELSRLLGARHICNFLEEQIEPLTDSKADYFEFKLKHWELMNSGAGSQRRLFKDYYKSEFAEYENVVKFVCSNVVSNEPLAVTITKSDYSILTIGRLDKPYVRPMTDRICDFAARHADKTINVIYVGGSPDGSLEKVIPSLYEQLNNVHVYMLGYTFPVPSALLDKVDVGIASANSILVTADYNIPTICIDINDYYALGVYGYTTKNKFLRQDEPKGDISVLLEEVLIDRKYPKRNGIQRDDEMDIELGKQLSYLDRSISYKGSYYDVYSMYKKSTIILAKMKWCLRRIIECLKLAK